MYYIMRIIRTLLMSIPIYMLYFSFFGIKPIARRKIIITYSLVSVVLWGFGIITLQGNYYMLSVSSIIQTVLPAFLSKGKMHIKLLFGILSDCIVCISFTLIDLFDVLLLNLDQNSIYNFIIQIVLTIILVSMLCFFRNKKLSNYKEDIYNVRYNKFLLAFLIVLGLSECLLMFYIIKTNYAIENDDLSVATLVIAPVFLVVPVAIIIIFMSLSKEKRLIEEQSLLKQVVIEAQKQQYDEMLYNYEKVNAIQHDMKSMMAALEILLENKEYENAISFIERINSKVKKYSVCHRFTDNNIIDSVINKKIKQAEEQGITVVVDNKINRKLKFDEFDMCVILSNAFSNAIEATKKVNDEKKQIIEFCMKTNNQDLFMSIKNPIDDMESFSVENSSKEEEGHGYGVRNMREAVRNLSGELNYNVMDNYVQLEIIIKITDN